MSAEEEKFAALVAAINNGDKAALEAASRWEVEAAWKGGHIKRTPLVAEVRVILDSCRESR